MDTAKVYDGGFIDAPENFYRLSVVVAPDFNGSPVLTAMVAGYPWTVLEWVARGKTSSPPTLNHCTITPGSLNHAETLINVGIVLGELEPNACEAFFFEYERNGRIWTKADDAVWDACVTGEGHGPVAVINKVVRVVYGTESPIDPEAML